MAITYHHPQKFGVRSELSVASMLRNKGMKVERCGYADHVDLIVNGFRVEVKASKRSNAVNSGRTQSEWNFNIHRHGTVNEDGVDFYILRLEDVPEFKYAIHLVIAAPINVKTVHISIRSLLNKYAQYMNRFDLLEAHQ